MKGYTMSGFTRNRFSHKEDLYKLGEGSYGCAIKGNFHNSMNKINYKYYGDSVGEVTKLMIDNTEFRNEIIGTLIANKLDNGNSSILIYGYSILDRRDINHILQKKRDLLMKIQNCESIIDNISNIEELYQIIYSKEGITLDMMFKQFNFGLYKIIKLCRNLVYGINIYSKYSFSHFDIKSNNIIYIPDDDKIVFIDYGLSRYYRNIDFDILLHVKNIYILPEIIFYNIIKINPDINADIAFELFKKEYESNLAFKNYYFKNILINTLFNNSEYEYNKELLYVFNLFYHKREKMSDMVFQSFKYIDSYKLCFTIMELIDTYKFRKTHRKTINFFYKNVLLPVVHINPLKRYNTSTLLNNYDLFLKILEKKNM